MATRIQKPKVTSDLSKFVGERERLAERGITAALIRGASEASVLTPIDTSLLLNSQFRRVTKVGTQIKGTVGYTAEYSLAVHDPANPQNFRRATAEKEFLKKGFDRSADDIRDILTGALKA